ncbi:FAD-dependent oxidoreductase [Actinomyces howellii]|uniref:Coenzyme A disulfide reductase n=1 Tax=Actinomyces howellii TaxID=52771 RepID=A0A448HFV3_9ACTO|nr:FAD-dependent oxidoreductase [Actinomyces howellii]VEG27441.1 Coenzyme A disulfide reductase [Actinomyces howellii]
MKIIIVGGVAGGATAAARIRRLDETAEILLIDKGEYLSYASCGLPYYVGGAIARRDALFVSSKEAIEATYAVDVRDLSLAKALDPGARTLTVKDLRTDEVYTERYDKLILATGSSPVVPALTGLGADNVFTLWTVPDADRVKDFVERRSPRRAVVVGAGLIGLEMVDNLMALGLEVTVVDKEGQVLAPLDGDMARLVENHLVSRGVDLRLGAGLSDIDEDGGRVRLDDGTSVETDMVVLSLGARPNSELARDAGLSVGERGHVLVDAELRTSDPDVYAVGDVTEGAEPILGGTHAVALAGPANRQGRAVAAAVLGREPEPYRGTIGTSVLRVLDLTAAWTGWSEKALEDAGKVLGTDFHVALVHPMSHAGYYPGASALTLKVVVDSSGVVLGAQAVGSEGVDKRIDTIAATIRLGGSADDLASLELAYAPPFSSAKDPVNVAGCVAQDVLAGLTRPVLYRQWRADPGAWTLLDVREDAEVAVGAIPGSVHVPLAQLRERLDELDPRTPYLVYCAVGLRGYVAERILTGHGFQAANLAGGYRTWCDLGPRDDEGGQEAAQATQSTTEAAASEAGTATDAAADPATDPVTDAAGAGAVPAPAGTVIPLDVCGMSCPGPIVEVARAVAGLAEGESLRVVATDPGFARDIAAWAQTTGNTLVSKDVEAGRCTAVIRKDGAASQPSERPDGDREAGATGGREKTIIVFDGDLDRALAAFVIANGAAAMGDRVNMFFTFWGLSVIRRPERPRTPKDAVSRAFAEMLPRGAGRLGLSRMNMGGTGAAMMRRVMRAKGVASLEELIASAQEAGVRLTACQMSMDIMGITAAELIDGVEIGGVATMLNDNDRSNMNLFI